MASASSGWICLMWTVVPSDRTTSASLVTGVVRVQAEVRVDLAARGGDGAVDGVRGLSGLPGLPLAGAAVGHRLRARVLRPAVTGQRLPRVRGRRGRVDGVAGDHPEQVGPGPRDALDQSVPAAAGG